MSNIKFNPMQVDGDGVVAIESAAIVAGEIATGAVDSDEILDGAITNADINFMASIDYSKLNLSGNVQNSDLSHPKMVVYQESVSAGSLTDGGGATGTFVLGLTIPAGSVFTVAAIASSTGFAGDTTATVQIGDGTDADRYMTGTPDVFPSALEGVALGQPSGTAWHDADMSTVTVTITSATDIGLVIADGSGILNVTLAYLDPQGVIV